MATESSVDILAAPESRQRAIEFTPGYAPPGYSPPMQPMPPVMGQPPPVAYPIQYSAPYAHPIPHAQPVVASQGYPTCCGSSMGQFWRYPPSGIFIAGVVCFATFIMAIVAVSIPQWRSVHLLSASPVLTDGSFTIGIFRACLDTGISSDPLLCHDRSDFKNICNKLSPGSCDNWLEQSWVTVVVLVIATAANLVAVTIAAMGSFCLVPINRKATHLTVLTLSVISFVAWVCYVIALGVDNQLNYNVFDAVRAQMLQELGRNPANFLFENYNRSHCYALIAACLSLELILFLYLVLVLVTNRNAINVPRDVKSFCTGRFGWAPPGQQYVL